MLQTLNKSLRQRKNKKGFTLVEVIVVLVILAILAAILIPSMIGWIDKANQKTATVEARSMLLAAQTVASEQYAKTPDAKEFVATQLTEVYKLAEIAKEDKKGFTVDPVIDKGKVKSFTYVDTTGKYQVVCDEGKLGTPTDVNTSGTPEKDGK